MKINIDFNILETGSTKLLSIFDNSDWQYAEPNSSYIVINLPGSKKDLSFSFKKYAINSFNSHNLGLTCFKGDCKGEERTDLPDGIYTINVKSNFENIEATKYYLKTDRFNVEFAKLMIKDELAVENPEFIEQMTKVRFLLDVAKSHAMFGDFTKASRFFEETKKLFKSLIN